MKTRLLAKILFLTLPFLVLNALYTATKFDGNGQYMRKFQHVPPHIELANTGSSHAVFGIDYAQCPGRTAFNFALPAQFLQFDLAVLDQYIGHFREGAVLLISVDYQGFALKVSDQALRGTREIYVNFLKRRYFDDMASGEFVRYRFFPVLMARHPFRKILVHFMAHRSDDEGRHNSMAGQTGAERAESALSTLAHWEDAFEFASVHDGRVRAGNAELVGTMAALCRAHGIAPVFVTFPASQAVTELLEAQPGFGALPALFEQFKADVLAANPGTAWLDYSHDAAFTEDYALFFDGDHMNDEGAAAMTRRILNDLRERRILD